MILFCFKTNACAILIKGASNDKKVKLKSLIIVKFYSGVEIKRSLIPAVFKLNKGTKPFDTFENL